MKITTRVFSSRNGVRSLFVSLIFATLCSLSPDAHASEPLSFSRWSITLNEGIAVEHQDAQTLVLIPDFPPQVGTASITFYSAKPLRNTPQEFIDSSWRSALKGESPAESASDEEVGLFDDITKGVRRYAPIHGPDGTGLLMVDNYFAGEDGLVIVTRADSEMAAELVGGALTLLQMGLRLNDGAGLANGLADDDPEPRMLPPDPYDAIDWSFKPPGLRTSYDLDEIDIRQVSDEFVSGNRHLVNSAVAKKLSFAEAMMLVEKILDVEKNKAALETVGNYLLGQSAEGYIETAAISVVNGMPENALAILWLGYKEHPEHPQLLFNIASLMAQTGEASASNAILQQLSTLGSITSHGFDITHEQAVGYTQAYNAMRLGELDEARQLLKPIVSANESFAEVSLLQALLNSTDGDEVRAPLLAGIYRRNPAKAVMETSTDSESEQAESDTDPDESDDGGEDAESVALNAFYIVDMSKGKPGVINPVYQPTSLEDAYTFNEMYKAQAPMIQGLIESSSEQIEVLSEKWHASVGSESEREHLMRIDGMFSEANARVPELKQLLKDRDRGIEDWLDAQDRITEDFGQKMLPIIEQSSKDPVRACQAMRNLVSNTHARIRVHTQYLDTMERRIHRLWHQYATALAALTDNPDFRTYWAARISLETESRYLELVGLMQQSVIYIDLVEDCNALALSEEEKKNRQQAELAPCDADKSVGIEFETPMPVKAPKPVNVTVGLEVNCEGFSVELGADLFKTLGLSIETEFKKDGSATIYVGPKIENPIENVGPTASTKAGAYITVDANGVKDAGVKSVTKVGTKIGVPGVKLTASQTIPSPPISFMSAASVPSNAGGLSNWSGPAN